MGVMFSFQSPGYSRVTVPVKLLAEIGEYTGVSNNEGSNLHRQRDTHSWAMGIISNVLRDEG